MKPLKNNKTAETVGIPHFIPIGSYQFGIHMMTQNTAKSKILIPATAQMPPVKFQNDLIGV